MYFLSVSILMLVSFFSRIGANSATNSTNPLSAVTTNLTNNDLIRVSGDLVARYKNDVENLKVRLSSLRNDVVRPLVERGTSLLADYREKVARKAALLEIHRVVNAALNHTSKQRMTVCYEQFGKEEVCKVINPEDTNPATVLNVDIAKLDQEIADADERLDIINREVTQADDIIVPLNFQLKNKMKVVEFLSQLYHV